MNPPIHSEDPEVQKVMKAAFRLYDLKKQRAVNMMRETLRKDVTISVVIMLHDEIYTGSTEIAEGYAPAIQKETDLTREDALLCIQQAVLMECADRYAKGK